MRWSWGRWRRWRQRPVSLGWCSLWDHVDPQPQRPGLSGSCPGEPKSLYHTPLWSSPPPCHQYLHSEPEPVTSTGSGPGRTRIFFFSSCKLFKTATQCRSARLLAHRASQSYVSRQISQILQLQLPWLLTKNELKTYLLNIMVYYTHVALILIW